MMLMIRSSKSTGSRAWITLNIIHYVAGSGGGFGSPFSCRQVKLFFNRWNVSEHQQVKEREEFGKLSDAKLRKYYQVVLIMMMFQLPTVAGEQRWRNATQKIILGLNPKFQRLFIALFK